VWRTARLYTLLGYLIYSWLSAIRPPLHTSIMTSQLENKPSQSQPSNPSTDRSDRFTRYLKNDPARTGFSPENPWWLNLFQICTGQVTKEGAFHYREWRYKVNEAKDCERCEKNRDWLLQNSPIVRFLGDKIKDLNGNLDASNILCRRCPARLTEDGQVHRQGGGFSPQHGILLCANEMRDWKHLEDTLAHEMVHAWDHLRWKMDATNNLRHAACTEVR
jgi:inner membrane protease ATP23